MQINPIQLENQNKIIDNYRKKEQNIMQYFDYGVSANNIKQRYEDLGEYSYKREELTKALTLLNQHWDAPTATLNNIERLKNEKSVVVIGGQQAGLLTGPMYTINKIISIIKYAKQQEEYLQVPVIPVFWIAGEDHDFDEVNHIYLPFEDRMKKYALPQYVPDKKSVTDITFKKAKVNKWIEDIFAQLMETEQTKGLYTTIKMCAKNSDSYVDFFARLIFQLFQNEGIVLMDSGSQVIRNIESDYFISMIHKQEEIATGVYGALQDLNRSGYSIDLDLEPDDGHLYLYKNNERILLKRTSSGHWYGKNNEVKLTTEELLAIAKSHPDQLSNNVISRPLMQEMLFPTLSFIGGPGEISYWSTLKPAFKALNIKMPPVVPRLSMTFISSNTLKLTNKFNLNLREVIQDGVENEKKSWLDNKTDVPIENVTADAKKKIAAAHKPLRDIAHGIRADIGAIGEKNLDYLYYNIDFLEKRISDTIKAQYKHEISEFNQINQKLYPREGLQERTWNPLLIFNQHGTHFLKSILQYPLSFEEEHFIIEI